MKLKRLRQCEKCPWKVTTDPNDIPNGYDVEKHRALKSTIAKEGDFRPTNAFGCHEHDPGDEAYCVGWLMNQLGPGNNIGLRIQMLRCENIGLAQLDGDQHLRFEDTLPSNSSPAPREVGP